jgi:hypothetical protein
MKPDRGNGELRLRRSSDAALLELLEARADKEGTRPLDVMRRAIKAGLEWMARKDEETRHDRET